MDRFLLSQEEDLTDGLGSPCNSVPEVEVIYVSRDLSLLYKVLEEVDDILAC